MSAPAGCCTPCQSVEVVDVPGTEGATGPAGANGTNGVNAYALLDGALTLPAVGAAVTSGGGVTNNTWAVVGMVVVSGDGTDFGTFRVTSLTGTTQLGLTFLGAPGDSAPGAIINSGSTISPGGAPQSSPTLVAAGGTGAATLTDRSVLIGRGTAAVNFAVPGAALAPLLSTGAATNPAFGALNLAGGAGVVTGQLPIASVALGGALPTAITDNSGGVASAVIAAGAGQFTHSVYFRAAAITGNVLLYTYTPGFAFKIIRISASVVDAITTVAKAATLTTAIAGTPTTGGVVTLAGAYALGAEQASSAAITAANTGTSVQAITVTASAVTAFVEGGFLLQLQIQNSDSANAIKSLSTDINTLITAL